MKARGLTSLIAFVALSLIAGMGFLLNNRSVTAAQATPFETPMTGGTPAASPDQICAPSTLPPMRLAIAFTSGIHDTSDLHLHLPWGSPGDPMGRMVEDYGAYNGTTIREQLPVYDFTTGRIQLLYGHNAIDIVLPSGTPLYAVTSGTVYQIRNWTIPGEAEGWAAVLVSDKIVDDHGYHIAFLYGHVREFDTRHGQYVNGGALIAKSGGGDNDPGKGFSDMPNVHFEIIESPTPLAGRAGTVNPRQFLEDLYAYAVPVAAVCSKSN